MKTRINALDGLRGYAVVLVFMVHFWGSYAPKASSISAVTAQEYFDFSFQGSSLGNLYFYLAHSHYGVEIFFVLSGFLIASILQNPASTLGQFLLNRLMRIYPAFLLSTAAALAMWFWVLHQPVELNIVLKNIVFLNGILFLKIPAVNGVTWSLFYEVAFYTVMALLVFVWGKNILRKPLFFVLLGAVVVAILQMAFGHFRGGMSLGLFLHLFLGAALAGNYGSTCVFRNTLAQVPTWLVLATWFCFTTLFSLGLINYPDWYYYPISGFATTLFVAKIAFSSGWLSRIFQWPPLVLLGRISYSFYLFHAMVIYLVFHEMTTSVNFVWLFIVLFVACALIAAVSYLLVERPYFRRSSVSTLSQADVLAG